MKEVVVVVEGITSFRKRWLTTAGEWSKGKIIFNVYMERECTEKGFIFFENFGMRKSFNVIGRYFIYNTSSILLYSIFYSILHWIQKLKLYIVCWNTHFIFHIRLIFIIYNKKKFQEYNCLFSLEPSTNNNKIYV